MVTILVKSELFLSPIAKIEKEEKKTVRIHVVCSKRQRASTGSNEYCLIEIH